jgi:O-acetyl-ADP-ribose deacetylase (regulator of RNase III)
MQIYLRDRNQSLVDLWNKVFTNDDKIHISCGDIFDDGEHMNADAVVSPANSFGFMDGGIDYVYSEFFGWDLTEHLKGVLWDEYQGELLVGQAVVVDIRETNPKTPIPYLISAPTMRVPLDVSRTVNAYLAFVAALREANKHKNIDSMLCPGLGTAIGKIPYANCAIQMHAAWNRYNKPPAFDVLGVAHIDHHSMISPDVYFKTHGI